MKRKDSWTQEEHEIILKLLGSPIRSYDIAKIINRTFGAIKNYIQVNHLLSKTIRICTYCKVNFIPTHMWQEFCCRQHKVNMNSLRRRYELRYKAIQKLGGKCINCGTTDIRVLQLNHINGGGKKEYDDYNYYISKIYQEIIDGTRYDIDLRCANCNILYEFECGRRGKYATFVTGDSSPR